jgi:hypothetical protein
MERIADEFSVFNTHLQAIAETLDAWPTPENDEMLRPPSTVLNM